MKKIRVLIVDDSALARETITRLLSSDPAIQVVGAAGTCTIALQKVALRRPDVITLDLQLPGMDGFAFLHQIMASHPVPVVVLSRFTEHGSQAAMRALDCGAVDVILKPRVDNRRDAEEARQTLTDAVKAASRVKRFSIRHDIQPKLSADAVLERPVRPGYTALTEKIILIGASTGGPEAIRILLQKCSSHFPGIVIVQHMPEHFTKAFACRLDDCCRMRVREAAHGDPVLPGRVLVAPGDRHLLIRRSGSSYFTEVIKGPLVNRHRPSVDVLFRSGAKAAGRNAIGVLLTGMGDDGARGLLEMKEAGAATLVQNEMSCVVFGMPQEAIKLGAADLVMPPERMAEALADLAYDPAVIV